MTSSSGSYGERLNAPEPHPLLLSHNRPTGTRRYEVESFSEKQRSDKQRKDFVAIVHAGVLSTALHRDGDARTIIANLGNSSGISAEDAPT